MENRRHKRFSATAFLNRPVSLEPIPPYFGHSVQGKLIDLSAGGMAILIGESIPQGTGLRMNAHFPDGFRLECYVQVRHTLPRNGGYLHGIEFLNLPAAVSDRIERMSTDYINCESRISNKAPNVCQTDCAFFTMCSKSEKIDPVLNPEAVLELTFKILENNPFAKTSRP